MPAYHPTANLQFYKWPQLNGKGLIFCNCRILRNTANTDQGVEGATAKPSTPYSANKIQLATCCLQQGSICTLPYDP